MPTTGAEHTQPPSERIRTLIAIALDQLDRVAGTTPGTRPTHLAHLGVVLLAAVSEARQADNDPAKVGRDADLWRLREPGYLRAICEHPVRRPNSAVVLLPVILTWITLGVAELLYLRDYAAVAVADRPSFFADWLGQPWYRGPVVLSVAIVLTAVWIMRGYRRPAREQAVADELDRIVHQLELDLLPQITILLSRLDRASVADTTKRAAADLTQAATLFLTATKQLASSMAVVDRLGTIVDRLVSAIPELRAQTGQLADLDGRLSNSLAEITNQLERLTEAVEGVTRAGQDAARTTTRSEGVLREADARLGEASALAERTAAQQATLTGTQQPLIDAAGTFTAAAGKLDTTVSAVHDTAVQLREVIKEVNWLAMVSDGLRHDEHDHGQAESPGEPGMSPVTEVR